MVVVQDADSVPVGKRRDEQVDGRKPVVTGPRELALRIHRPPFDFLVNVNMGEALELVEDRLMVDRAPRRIPGLQEERKAGRNPALEHGFGDLVGARERERRAAKPRPR